MKMQSQALVIAESVSKELIERMHIVAAYDRAIEERVEILSSDYKSHSYVRGHFTFEVTPYRGSCITFAGMICEEKISHSVYF